MTRAALLTLNSAGTKGHSVPGRRLAAALSGQVEVLSCAYGEADVVAPHQDVTNSVGGAFPYHACEELAQTLLGHGVSVAVFSLFYDPRMVARLRDLGVRTALLTIPLRDSHAAALAARGTANGFERVFVFEDYYEMELPGSETVSPLHPETVEAASGDVVVSCGGGGLPSSERFQALVDRAIPAVLEAEPGLRFLVADPAGRSTLRDRRVRVVPWIEAFPSVLGRHRLSVSEAGYHTVSDLRRTGTPSVLIPGARRVDNQELRAVRHGEHGSSLCVFPEEGAAAVVEAMLASLGAERRRHEFRAEPVDRALLRWMAG